jgi:N-glycosidase YbiA
LFKICYKIIIINYEQLLTINYQLVNMTIYFYKVGNPYGCFSNFSPHLIHCFGKQWPTVEHFYQANKFVGTKQEHLIEIIRQVKTPEEAAAIGRNTTNHIRYDWDNVKKNIMWQAVATKFTTHLDIQEILLATGDETLIEDSPRDYYWGCGQNKTGQNELGKILMAVRTTIRANMIIK